MDALFVNTIRQPIATLIKKEVAAHPQFRRFIIKLYETKIWQGQRYERPTSARMQALQEDRAVEVAAESIVFLFIFGVGTAALGFHSHKKATNEDKRNKLKQHDFELVMQPLAKKQNDEAQKLSLLAEDFELLKKEMQMRSMWGLPSWKWPF